MEGRNEVNDERKACIDQKLCPRYRKSRKKVKGEVLTEFTEMTGYNRCYGAYLLRHQGKRIRLGPKGWWRWGIWARKCVVSGPGNTTRK